MNKYKAKNEKIKRRYFKWLEEAEGFSPKTIESIEKALWDYELFSKEEDYAKFNDSKAKEFKKWLSEKKLKNGQTISLQTQYTRLRHLKNFFTWLSGQSGYKSKISNYDTHYLKLDKKRARIALAKRVEDYPTIEYVKNLCNSIEIKNEIDLRDRALIAFTLLSGMRDKAIITLPIGCFNPNTYEITQDPTKGVETKFSKTITSVLFRFDDTLIEYVIDWYNYLVEEKSFGMDNPLFPATKLEQKSDNELIYEVKGVEPVYWKSTNTIRKIFEQRCKEADMKYYSPHKYRHTATRFATDSCRTPEQMKAVSQNLGHEYIGTTLYTYGKIDTHRVKDIVSNINYKRDNKKETIKNLLEQLNDTLVYN